MALPNPQQGSGTWQTRGVMSDTELQRWIDLLEQRTGMVLPRERQSFLLTSLQTRIRELGLNDYAGYYQYLHQGVQGDLEWELLVDRLTVHESRFMRDEHALSLLRSDCLPQFAAAHKGGEALRVWSVGCATGEEPYSLAMVIDDYLDRHERPFDFQVLATDISLASLITGQWGIYPNSRGTNLTPAQRERYTRPHDARHFKVEKTLRDKVRFSQLNLLALDKTAIAPMDIIICQNVLIYFPQARRRAILDHLVGFLKPGGTLILGAGEILHWTNARVTGLDFPSTLAFRRLGTDMDTHKTVRT